LTNRKVSLELDMIKAKEIYYTFLKTRKDVFFFLRHFARENFIRIFKRTCFRFL